MGRPVRGVEHRVNLGGRWVGCPDNHRPTGETHGSGTVALSNDGFVLSGQRHDSGSSRIIAVILTLTRRGGTLEGSNLGPDNRVYTTVLTRSQ
jgi:hypothetical protein